MKKMYFKIGDYSFSNKLEEVKKYFIENEIEYTIKYEFITFCIKLDDIWIEGTGEIYNDRITKYHFYKSCKTEEESKMLKKYITSSYPKEYDEYYCDSSIYTTFPSCKFKLLIMLSNGMDFSLHVLFENNKHKRYKEKIDGKTIFSYVGIILCAIIGLFLTIQFIYMYEKSYDKNMLIVSAIISYLYMAISIFVMCLFSDVEKKNCILWPIFLPIIYVLIVLIILLLIGLNSISTTFIDYLMWSIYSMPAFIIVIVIVGLVLLLLGHS